jgi:type VI secretion system protein ImpJ
MANAEKVLWAEGIFLGQQHFQQWDNYLENQLQQRMRLVAPLHWGLQTLAIDEDALLNGNYRIQKTLGIFSNGQWFNYSDQDGADLSCKLTANTTSNINIYLAIPTNKQASGIAGYDNSNQRFLWKANYRQIFDSFDNGREREVLFGQLNLMLLTDQDAQEGFCCFKIAEVLHAGGESFQLVKTFIPSSINLRPSNQIQILLTKWLEIISAKIRLLNQRRHQFSGDSSEFGHNNLEHFLLLQILNSTFVKLHYWQQHLETHPQILFLTVLELLGALATFSESFQLNTLPSYEHDNLTASFSQLDQSLRDLLEVVMPSRMAPLKLRRESDSLYLVDHVDSSLFHNTHFYLAVNFVAEDPQWITQFARQIKVGSAQSIDSIVTSALPGVPVIHRQRPPGKLPIKTGYEYFSLAENNSFWEQIKQERSIGIFLPFNFINATIELVTVQD